MKLIQLGITVSDDKGHIKGTWQFNFNFDLESDASEPEAINILQKAGINFNKLTIDGILTTTFAKHFGMIGLAANTQVTWLAFNSKYDFAYLLSLFAPLPETVDQFLQ
jgi:hypothetical protein